MPRPRRRPGGPSVRAEMPYGTWCVRAKGKVYCYHQPGRGSKNPGQRVRIPFTPDDPNFWLWHKERGLWAPVTDESLEGVVEQWFASPSFKALADASRTIYQRFGEQIIDRWGARPINDISRNDVLEWRRTMEDRPPTANQAIKIVAAFWKWAMDAGLATESPMKDITPYHHEAKQAKPWPDWAFPLVEEHGPWRLRAFVEIGRYTGLRTADIVRLHLRDFEKGELRITIQKKRHRREHLIPLHPALDPLLSEARKHGALYLFAKRDGHPLGAQVFRTWFWHTVQEPPLRLIYEAGLSPHGLRVLAVNTLLELGCTPAEVGAITDQTMQTVEHYARQRNQEHLARRAMRKWAESTNGE